MIRRLRQSSLSTRILLGLGLGIAIGIFVGEPAAILQPVADIYIRLMQMMVLPYLVTSLIIGFGQLDAKRARLLALRGGAVLLLVWLLVSVILILLPQVLPPFESASFYSHALTLPAQELSFTDIYFTDNPFDSLSRNVVPAVVLFSSLIGVGLIGLQDKERLLDPLRIWNTAIVRITNFIIELTPYGVLAIAAVTAGTITTETLSRLEAYFMIFIAASLLLAILVLPLLVTAVTPFRYREVAGMARDALLTAFIANSAFIVLPILIDRCKTLLAEHELLDEETNSATEIMIPIMFNFPNAGKLLSLLFIPFAAWLSGAPLPATDYGQLLAVGIPSYFAKAQVALPFLLDVFSLPHDLFQLYIPTTILTGKFDSLVTAVNLLVFALLGAAAMGGFLVFDRVRLLRAGLAIAGGTALTVGGAALLMTTLVDTSYHMDEVIRKMQYAERHAETIVRRQSDTTADGEYSDLTPLQRIRARGTLRVGYDPKNLPMSFFNDSGELVGFDVELGEELADALGVRAEFVPIHWPDLAQMLEQGIIDVMPGMWYRPYWFGSLKLSAPYFTGTIGLATLDRRRHEFERIDQLRLRDQLTIGVPLAYTQLETSMRRYFGQAEIHYVVLETSRLFFEGDHPELDAFLMPAEHASAWTLLYPQYTVVVPQPDPVHLPSAFGLSREADDLLSLVNEWVTYAESAGIVQRAHEFWIQGQGATTPQPRWSILRDVLGWVD